MPTISLRLTEQEHAALKDWAHGSHRSMQREAVYRIFEERSLSERVRPEADLGLGRVRQGSVNAGTKLAETARSESDTHFKPDFK